MEFHTIKPYSFNINYLFCFYDHFLQQGMNQGGQKIPRICLVIKNHSPFLKHFFFKIHSAYVYKRFRTVK